MSLDGIKEQKTGIIFLLLPSFDLNPSAAKGEKKDHISIFNSKVHFAFKLKIETVLFGGIFVSPAHLIFDYQTSIFFCMAGSL